MLLAPSRSLYSRGLAGGGGGGGGEPPADALFVSDWSTALGTSDAALRDTDKALPWGYERSQKVHPTYGPLGGAIHVVSAAGLGFPAAMQHVLRVNAIGEASNEVGHNANAFPAYEAGDERYYRYYIRFATSDLRYVADHSIQLSYQEAGGTSFAQTTNLTDTGVTWCWNNLIANGGAVRLDHINGVLRLAYDTTYRIEMRTSFPTLNSVRIDDVRIYTVAPDGLSETLTWVEADFDAFDFSETAGNWGPFETIKPVSDVPNPDIFRRFMMGYNGQAGAVGGGFRYYGGVMIRSLDWCGAY